MEADAAAAIGLDDPAAAVGQDVEADRLAQVRRSRHEVHLVVGEHGGAAVAVDGVGDAGRPAQGPVEVLLEVRVGEARLGRPERRVERAPALVVLAPGDWMVGAHRAVDRVQHPVVGLLGERLLDDGHQHVADTADVGVEVVPAVGPVPVLGQVLAGVVNSVRDLDRAQRVVGPARGARSEDAGQEPPLGFGLDRRAQAHEAAPCMEPLLDGLLVSGPELRGTGVEEEHGFEPLEAILLELLRPVGDDDVEVVGVCKLPNRPHRIAGDGRRRPPAPDEDEQVEIGLLRLRRPRQDQRQGGDHQRRQPTSRSHLSIPLP